MGLSCQCLANRSSQPLRPAARRSRVLTLAWAASLVLLAIATLGITASGQEDARAMTATIVQPQAYVSLQPVPRVHSFEIAVVAKISPGFHVNAHEPSEEYLIPTKVTTELPAGIFVVETTYPRGVMRAFRFSKTPLRVYEGSFTIRMKLRADGSAPLGTQKIGLTVGYQACNQDSCLPPTKVPLTANLQIAAVGAPTHPANADIFTPASAPKPTSKN